MPEITSRRIPHIKRRHPVTFFWTHAAVVEPVLIVLHHMRAASNGGWFRIEADAQPSSVHTNPAPSRDRPALGSVAFPGQVATMSFGFLRMTLKAWPQVFPRLAQASLILWRAVAFWADGDGGRKSPELPTRRHVPSQRWDNQARCQVMFPDNARPRRLLPRLQRK
jgi:hypothetical protein